MIAAPGPTLLPGCLWIEDSRPFTILSDNSWLRRPVTFRGSLGSFGLSPITVNHRETFNATATLDRGLSNVHSTAPASSVEASTWASTHPIPRP